MPERPTVVSYAAGASLAAVALIYVFGPTFAIDNEATSSRKKTIVGLRNQANDCFINSTLQALAGLPDLRDYLIRETHRRRIEDPNVYAHLVQPEDGSQPLPLWKLQGLQEGLVTQGLKEMLDALNERPIARKSISPFQFVRVLEVAFKQRISRQQQDAQEFLQIVAERLKDEYHAGQRARGHARSLGLTASTEKLAQNGDKKDDEAESEEQTDQVDGANATNGSATQIHTIPTTSSMSLNTTDTTSTSTAVPTPAAPPDLEHGFPMEGRYESHLECQTCRYKTKPREETFCSLTVAVPQVSSTTLSDCFDGIFKTEYIDEFKCEMCRLLQTKSDLEHELSRSTSDTFRATTQQKIDKLRVVIETDPENPPEDVELGDIRYAPKRKIAKTTRMTVFPKVLAVHLSRSIYGGAITQKNTAKVSFPEQLPMGGLADQHQYKLLGMVSHRGGHNSGHYEAFRRQNLAMPYHNTNTFQKSEVYSRTPTPISTPVIRANGAGASPAISTPDLLSGSEGGSEPSMSTESLVPPPRSVPLPSSASPLSPSSSSPSALPSAHTAASPSPTKEARERDGETSSLRSVAASTKSALSRLATSSSSKLNGHLNTNSTNGNSTLDHETGRSSLHPSSASLKGSKSAPPAPAGKSKKYHLQQAKKRKSDKWWRVSDEKVREAKTSEVLGMQKEVYLLFYELDRDQA